MDGWMDGYPGGVRYRAPYGAKNRVASRSEESFDISQFGKVDCELLHTYLEMRKREI